MKAPEYFSRYQQTAVRGAGKAARNVAAHVVVSLIWVSLAVVALLSGIAVLGMEGVLLAVIALPAGVLAGISVRQALTKHPEWMLSEPSYRRILFLLRKCEPTLFWFGFAGAAVVALATYSVTMLPAILQFDPLTMALHIVLHILLLGCIGAGTMFFVHLRQSWKYITSIKPRQQRRDARFELINSFLQEIQHRQN